MILSWIILSAVNVAVNIIQNDAIKVKNKNILVIIFCYVLFFFKLYETKIRY